MKEKITHISIGQGITEIGSHAFVDYTSLKSVDLPEGMLTIKYSAFSGSSLSDISFPKTLKEIRICICKNTIDGR